jgi:RNA polymerase sigma-70 factor, ECF subfamily
MIDGLQSPGGMPGGAAGPTSGGGTLAEPGWTTVEQLVTEPDFDAFYLANFDRLIVTLHAYTGDLATAQDVVQEAFARALSRWSRLVTYDDPVAWVRRVALNLATSNWRRLVRFSAFARREPVRHVPEPSPDRVALMRALATLPPRQRRAMVLHYLADLSIAEIADQERVAPGTVKAWLHRARTALAAALSDTEGNGTDA